ncbi:Cell division protein FtsB [Bienertia sinuspersici]
MAGALEGSATITKDNHYKLIRGDTLYIIHVKPSSDVESRNLLWFREPDIMKKYDVKTDIEVLNMCDIASRQKEITVVAKIYWGDLRENVLESNRRHEIGLFSHG